MGQLKLVPQGDKTGGNRRIGENASGHPSTAADRVRPMQRVATAEVTRNPPRAGDPQKAAQTERPSVAAPDPRPVATAEPTPPASPRFVLTSGIRILIGALILVALVPNLILGAMFWFGAINTPSLKPETPAPTIQTATPPAVLTAPPTIEATAGEEIGFPIALDGTDGVPARSIIAISGLPHGASFSDGRPFGEAEWNLRSDQIGDLRLILPDTANGESKLTIKLIAPDDKVIADTETILKVAPAATEQAVEPDGTNAAMAAIQDNVGVEERLTPQEAAVASSGDTAAAPSGDAATASSEQPVKSPPDNPDKTESNQTENDEGSANWVRPSAYVNFRDGPSSSSRIVGVIAKGAKLSVTDRKRGWLQVTDPATSKEGWIYSGYIEGAPKSRPRTKRSTARAEPEQKSQSSFWDWLTQ
jgi:SH3 domain-containing protein